VETLKVVADPLRLRMLDVLRQGPATVKQLARELDTPLRKLYYHVNLLETNGLIKVVGTRLVSGILEKQYQATAYRLTVDRALLSRPIEPEPSDEGLDVLLSVVLDQAKSEIRKSVQAGLIDPAQTSLSTNGLALGRVWLRLTPVQANSFYTRLIELAQAYLAQESDPEDGDTHMYEVLLGVYPTLPGPLAADDSTKG
jgi:DNA-binding transcriptional ArsR family regulator